MDTYNQIDRQLSREQILQLLDDILPILASRYGVEKIGLFGSFAQNQAGVDSDIDLVVHLKQPLGFAFFEMATFLEEKLGRPVDLITYESLKRGFANPRRAHIAAEIEKSIVWQGIKTDMPKLLPQIKELITTQESV